MSKRSQETRDFLSYLDNDELLLQGFPVGELLPKAHVDGVLRRAALVLPKLLELWKERQSGRV